MPLSQPPQRRMSGRAAVQYTPAWLLRRRRLRPWMPRPNPISVSVTSKGGVSQGNPQGPGGPISSTGTAAGTVVTDSIYPSATSSASVSGRFKINAGDLANGQRLGGMYCFERTSDGTLFMADGWGAMLKWDGFAYTAATVGVAAPTTAPTMGGSGVGALIGTYYAYVRYIDKDGNPSALSPISPVFSVFGTGAAGVTGGSGTAGAATGAIGGFTGTIDNVIGWSFNVGQVGPGQGGFVTIVSNSLASIIAANAGGTPSVSVSGVLNTGPITGLVISGVTGTTEANGTFGFIGGQFASGHAIPPNGFGLAAAGVSNYPLFQHAYTGGGTWSAITTSSSGASNTAPIVITSANHGLATGNVVKISGVQGNDAANGTWTITVIDQNNFSLNGSVGDGNYLGGGSWVVGIGSITYSNVPIPTESKVVRRQILRNTDGQTDTFYVDVDTTDLTSTTFTSTNTDAVLQTNTAVPLFDSEGNIFANQYGIPPNWKSIIANHQGRMYAAVDVAASEGHVSVTLGSSTVTGIGTNWMSSFAGRYLYVTGSTQGYQIQSVDPVGQTLTLGVPASLQASAGSTVAPTAPAASVYLDGTDAFAQYAIRPAPAERKLVYFSGPTLPEAFTPVNAFSLPEDNDDLTGLMSMSSFLYCLEERHIYRWTCQANPATDGFVFLAALRGCINNRSWVVVEDAAYMLDTQGIHKFDGSGSQPISQPIQDLFRSSNSTLRINWKSSRYFHASHYPGQEAIRWFVSLDGSRYPQHAIGYSYRHNRWWLEQFPWPISSSTLWPTSTPPTFLAGTEAARVLGYWQGTLDGPDPTAGTCQSTATSATFTTLTDTAQAWPAKNVVNAPVAIIAGTGKGQVRRIRSVSGNTLTVEYPWLTLPDTTSQYQIGGVQWDYQGGWFRWAATSMEEARRIELMFEPYVSAGTLDIRIYKDFAATPQNWDTDYVSSDNDSVAVTTGSPDAVVDLTKTNGLVQVRIPGGKDPYVKGWRFVWVELRGFSNADALQIYQMVIDAVT